MCGWKRVHSMGIIGSSWTNWKSLHPHPAYSKQELQCLSADSIRSDECHRVRNRSVSATNFARHEWRRESGSCFLLIHDSVSSRRARKPITPYRRCLQYKKPRHSAINGGILRTAVMRVWLLVRKSCNAGFRQRSNIPHDTHRG